MPGIEARHGFDAVIHLFDHRVYAKGGSRSSWSSMACSRCFCDVGLGGKQLVRISSEIEGGMTYQEEQLLPIRQADIPDLSFLGDPGLEG